MPVWEQDKIDANNLYDVLENKVIPMYYEQPEAWQNLVFNAMNDIVPEFSSNRMAEQYYKELYK
jgi:starch phosphorylase